MPANKRQSTGTVELKPLLKKTAGKLLLRLQCMKHDDQMDNWRTNDNYILDYFDVRISQGICPECTHTLYPDLIKIDKSDIIQP